MAAELGISISYLGQIENDVKKPSKKVLNRFSQVFNIPVSMIIFEVLNERDIKDEEYRRLFIKAKPVMDDMIAFLLED